MHLAYAYEPSYCDRMSLLLDRVDYRLAVTDEEREPIFRLRYEAYRREKTIPECSSGTFSDAYDDTGLVKLFGVYVDGNLVSSIRIHVANAETPYFPSLGPFSDILQPEIESEKTIIDPTRFATDMAASRQLKGLPHITLRLCWLAAEHYNAEHFLVAVRPEHQAFYRRTFQHQAICEARTYPLLATPISLMSVSRDAAREYVLRRYPFYRSSAFERRMLFGEATIGSGQSVHRRRDLELVPPTRAHVGFAG